MSVCTVWGIPCNRRFVWETPYKHGDEEADTRAPPPRRGTRGIPSRPTRAHAHARTPPPGRAHARPCATARRATRTMSVDPFAELKGICKKDMRDLEALFGAWEAALRNSNTETDPTYRKRRKKLAAKVDKVVQMLNDLDLAVRAVSRARAQYPHIDDAELASRREFTAGCQGRVREMQGKMRSQRVRDKQAADKRAALTGAPGAAGGGGGGGGGGGSNADFLRQQQAEQKEIRGQQDEILDDMSAGVEQLDVMSKALRDELDEEKRLLEQFERDMEEAQARMNVVLRGMSKLLKTKNTCQLWLILFLTLTIVMESIFLFWVD